MIDAKDNYGATPLHIAAHRGGASSVEVLKCLIENGAFINARSEYGATPLHSAAMAKDSNIEVLKCLMENGADVTEKDDNGETPIDLATEKGHQDVVNYLTEIMMEKKKAENEKIPEENSSLSLFII